MRVLVLFVILLLVNSGLAFYTCDCYCPNKDTRIGTATSFSCSSSACMTACLAVYSKKTGCASPTTLSGSCGKGLKRHYIP